MAPAANSSASASVVLPARRGRPGRRCGSCPVGIRLHRLTPRCSAAGSDCRCQPVSRAAWLGAAPAIVCSADRAWRYPGPVTSRFAGPTVEEPSCSTDAGEAASSKGSAHRRPAAPHRHHRRPPHRLSGWSWRSPPPSPSASASCASACSSLVARPASPTLLDGAVAKASGTRRPAGRLLRLGDRPGLRRRCCSVASPGTSASTDPGHARRCCRSRCWRRARCSSPTSGPRPSRSASTPAAASWSGPSASSLLGVGLLFDIAVVRCSG